MNHSSPPPSLEGVTHRYVDVAPGVTIHVADAGPEDGTPVMLVHGFPENWWEWRELIGPLAADGHRVVVPDLRGAGWSSVTKGPYRKADMARDLATVLDRLGIGPVTMVAHDWGGPVAFIVLLDHPEKVTGFFGVNTIAPWLVFDGQAIRNVWRFWYQFPMLTPVLGPLILSDPKGRYLRMLARWVGGGFTLSEEAWRVHLERMSDRRRAMAGSRWYRTFQAREFLPWVRGKYQNIPVNVPVRWLSGTDDPVITPDIMRGYHERLPDYDIEFVDGVGHWIVEQRPDLVLDRVRAFLSNDR